MSILHMLDDSDFDELVINSRIGIKLISRTMEQSSLPENIKGQINSILNNQLHKEKILSLVENIVDTRRSVKNLFKAKNIKDVYKSNENVIHLLKPCNKEVDFNNLILVLCGIINDDLEGFKNMVTMPGDKSGSIVAFEEYLKAEFGEDGFNPVIVKNLRDIFTLRSQKFPIHVDTSDWIKKAASYGFFSPIDWHGLGYKCLELYFESLSNTFIKIS